MLTASHLSDTDQCITLHRAIVQDTPLPEVSREPRGKVSICCILQLHACPVHRIPSALHGHILCRDFVLSHYHELKKANPKFPILIRECGGVQAQLVARYGELARFSLNGQDAWHVP